MDLDFGGAQVLMVLLHDSDRAFVVSSGKSAWYLGVQLLAVYAVFAVTFYLIPN
jgi:Ca2+:H+ antiporter